MGIDMTTRRRRRRTITSPGRPLRQPPTGRQGTPIPPDTTEFQGITSTIQRNPPQNEFRADGHLHVSDLVYKCLRQIALGAHLHQPIRGEAIMDSRGITFEIGRAVQRYVTQRLIHNAPDMLWGDWGCRCGETLYRHAVYSELPASTCTSCGGDMQYIETVWIDEERNITGSVDLVLLLPSGHYYPIEVKSIVGARWEDITRPLPEHLIQSMFYWNLMHQSGLPMLDQYSVLYVKKEMVFQSPYKEIFVTPSDHQSRLTDFLEEAEELKRYFDTPGGDQLPLRTICSTPLSPAAKKCPFALQCFALSPPTERP